MRRGETVWVTRAGEGVRLWGRSRWVGVDKVVSTMEHGAGKLDGGAGLEAECEEERKEDGEEGVGRERGG